MDWWRDRRKGPTSGAVVISRSIGIEILGMQQIVGACGDAILVRTVILDLDLGWWWPQECLTVLACSQFPAHQKLHLSDPPNLLSRSHERVAFHSLVPSYRQRFPTGDKLTQFRRRDEHCAA